MVAGQTLWVAIVLSVFAQIRGQPLLTVSPPSVAGANGDQNITINCTIQNPGNQTIVWDYRPSWSPDKDVPIFNTYYGSSSLIDADNYSVAMYDYQSPQGFQYRSADLTIKSANPGQAATYTCGLFPATSQTGTSSFLVLDPLQCPAQDMNEYAVGTIVNISCSVNFYHGDGLGRGPMLRLYKGDPGIPLPGVPGINKNTRTLTVSETLRSEDDNVEFICRLSFANDDPIYYDNCSVAYYVKHGVSEITFYPPSSSGNLTSIPVGGQITCTANGRPAPTINWYNDNGNLLTEGNLLTVTQDMQSWAQPVSVICRANNTINGGLNYTSIDANYTFLVVDAVNPPVVQSSGVEAWVIAVAVIVPVVVLTAIAIAIFFIIRHRKKKKKAKKAANGSTIYNATSATAAAATTTATSYTPVATSDPTYGTPNRPPPASAAAVSLNSAYGPPGFDGRHDTVRYSPGFGDLGTQPYGGSTHAVNAYPTRNSSVHGGSSQALGGVGLSMNPNPGYQGAAARASNPALNVSSSSRPAYPYKGSNPRLDASLSLNPNPGVVGYGRQPSSSASSTLASGYNGQAMHGGGGGGYPNDLSSMPGSEV